MAFFGAPRPSAHLGLFPPARRDLASGTKTPVFRSRSTSCFRPVSTSPPRIYLITCPHVHASLAATGQLPRRLIMPRVCPSPSPLPVSSRRFPLSPAQRLFPSSGATRACSHGKPNLASRIHVPRIIRFSWRSSYRTCGSYLKSDGRNFVTRMAMSLRCRQPVICWLHRPRFWEAARIYSIPVSSPKTR
ncbi:hypothetical protein EDB85DRAFT_1957500 [Lactarius pseudohatsudake]|nr:hypothetical protein EDB85DRAFT_1957500 [Lactarius pseudohatsudake]